MTFVKLMGILNATPDSFFDRGQWSSTQEQTVQRGLQIEKEGADWIDIGGESTRPHAKPVDEEEELRRVIPIIKALKPLLSIPLSIDTMKARVALEAVSVGAQMINDVRGFRDEEMRKVAAETQVKICVMHMRETPHTMQNNPTYPNGIVSFLIEWFKERIELLLNSGIQKSKIILDPGIGFGKTVDDNLKIIHNLHEIKKLGFPLLIGLSRKSFMGKILNKTSDQLLTATLAMNLIAIQQQADIIRAHDIREHRDLIDLMAYSHQ